MDPLHIVQLKKKTHIPMYLPYYFYPVDDVENWHLNFTRNVSRV